MTKPLSEAIIPLLQAKGLTCIRTGAGQVSEFWGKIYGDRLTIRIQKAGERVVEVDGKPTRVQVGDAVALCFTITFKNPSEKSFPVVLRDSSNKELQATTMEEFMAVYDTWTSRVHNGV